MRRIAINDIANILRKYDRRYRWLDVFADQVRELVTPTDGVSISALGADAFRVRTDSSALDLQIDRSRSVARWSLTSVPETDRPTGALVGAALGGLIAAETNRKGPEEIVLGLLVGAMLGHAADPDRNRIMTLSFNPKTQSWNVYNGPYVQWAKEALRNSG